MTKKKLKKQNKQLRKDIDILIKGSWMEKVLVIFRYHQLYEIEKQMWYGKPTKINEGV